MLNLFVTLIRAKVIESNILINIIKVGGDVTCRSFEVEDISIWHQNFTIRFDTVMKVYHFVGAAIIIQLDILHFYN